MSGMRWSAWVVLMTLGSTAGRASQRELVASAGAVTREARGRVTAVAVGTRVGLRSRDDVAVGAGAEAAVVSAQGVVQLVGGTSARVMPVDGSTGFEVLNLQFGCATAWQASALGRGSRLVARGVVLEATDGLWTVDLREDDVVVTVLTGELTLSAGGERHDVGEESRAVVHNGSVAVSVLDAKTIVAGRAALGAFRSRLMGRKTR